MAEEYKDNGGIDYIDAIFGTFTGRVMAPCATADFVGLDVHKAIIDNLYANSNDYEHKSYVLPKYITDLISEKKLGRKSGEGLFKLQLNEDGSKTILVYDILKNSYREKNKYSFEFANKMKAYLHNGDYVEAFLTLKNDNSLEGKICKDLLKRYVEYALFVGKEVAEDISYIDDAMATGFNWCPPLAMSNVLFGTNYPTKYDFRSFFKAVK